MFFEGLGLLFPLICQMAGDIVCINLQLLGTSCNCFGQGEVVTCSVADVFFLFWIWHLQLATSNIFLSQKCSLFPSASRVLFIIALLLAGAIMRLCIYEDP